MSDTVAIKSDPIPFDAAPGFKWSNRYVVGQTYSFICAVFDAKEKGGFAWPPYCPWLHTNLDMKVIVLKCTERHAVAWNQDPNEKKEYTGFIFVDKDNHIWHNQYPHAGYGQLDDSADRRVRPACWETDGKWHGPFEGTRFSYSEHLVQFQDALSFAANIESALRRDAAAKAGSDSRLAKVIFDEAQVQQLREYQQQVGAAIEAASGKKLVYEDSVWNYSDGSPKTNPLIPDAMLI